MLRADSEFMSGPVCDAAEEAGYNYIFSSRQCAPPFPEKGWYQKKRIPEVEFNSCEYIPTGWKKKRKFVVMRLPKRNDKKLLQKQNMKD